MHESAVTALSKTFFYAIDRLVVNTPMIWDHLDTSTGREIAYVDGEGWHVPDLSIRANRNDVFRVEVAFSQSLSNVHRKIADMLKDECLIGVLLVKIKETPKWSSPVRKPTSEDRMSKTDWFASMEQGRPFGCISSNGINWVNDIDVQVVLFERGWEAGHREPDTVRSFYI
jgi:hypothetical protein